MSDAATIAEDAERKVYIAELSELVDRRVNTVRRWCTPARGAEPRLPAHLMPRRDTTRLGPQTGWRYWTPEQVAQIRIWMAENNMRPGGGLNYDPTPEQEAGLLKMLRARRRAA